MAFGPEGGPRPKRLHPRTPDFYGGQSRGACLSFRRATYDGVGSPSGGLCPGADRVTAASCTQLGAWMGMALKRDVRSGDIALGDRVLNGIRKRNVALPPLPFALSFAPPNPLTFYPGRRPNGCLSPSKASQHQAVGRRGKHPRRRKLPPESCRCTSADAPVALSGVLRGWKAWRVGRPSAHSSRISTP